MDTVDFSSVRWGSVEWTNLVTLYLRAHESRSAKPILGDHAAAAAVDRIDYDFARIRRTMLPAVNQYLVALRARQLDDWCTAYLDRHPGAVVLHLGCGLDSRASRVDPARSIQWFDVDQPDVIALRRRLYADTQRYRMIGASVTDPGWLDEVPPGHPTLVVAEGLLMYLEKDDVRRLLQRLTDRFGWGEMLFDTLSASAPLLSRLFTRGIIRWGVRDTRSIEAWNPRLRLLERTPALAGYERIPSPMVRLIYRSMWVTARHYDVLNRFQF